MRATPERRYGRTPWRLRAAALLAAAGLIHGLATAQTPKPERKPSLSPAAAGSNQTSQLPAGTDTGEPGGGAPSSLDGTAPRDQTRSSLLRSRDAAASGANDGIEDSAAARAAARKPVASARPTATTARPAPGAASGAGPSSAGPSRRPSPPGR